MRRNLVAILSLTLFVIFTASVVKADTIEITSGTYVIGHVLSPEHTVNITGTNFGLSGGGTGNANFPGCDFCQPGQTITTNLNIVGLDQASASFNGVGCTQGFDCGVGVVLNFSGSGFTFPSPTAGMMSFSITVPFTFTGRVTATDLHPGGGTLFDNNLFGDGLVTLDYFVIPLGTHSIFQLRQVTYDFAPPAVPEPEPATLLLLSSGLAGVGLFARKKRRRASGR